MNRLKASKRFLLSTYDSFRLVPSRTLKSGSQLLRVLGTLEPSIGAVCPLLSLADCSVGRRRFIPVWPNPASFKVGFHSAVRSMVPGEKHNRSYFERLI